MRYRRMMKTLLYLLTVGFASFHMACVAGGDSNTKADSGVETDTGADSLADSLLTSDVAGLSDSGQQTDTAHEADTAQLDAPTPADSGTIIADAGAPDDGGQSDSGMADAKAPLPKGLSGVAPPGDTALAQFSAVVDQDGKSVGPDRLVGTWSVLWFYPIASTAG